MASSEIKRRRNAAYRKGLSDGVSTAHELLTVAQRLSKWDRDFPVNCHNGYAGLKELDLIIADARSAIAKATSAEVEL